jgi:putative drug exporter of the RND superfamily
VLLPNSHSTNAMPFELIEGADTIAGASRRLAYGVQLLVDQTKHMGAGFADAPAFLREMKYETAKPPIRSAPRPWI